MTAASLTARLAARFRAWIGRSRLRHTPLFDAAWYLQSYPDVAASGADPATHYLTYGAAEGRDPGPLFSTSGYRLQGWQGRGNPLLHHLAHPAEFAARPVFPGAVAADGAPVVLFVGHQALGLQFGAERSFLHMLDRARQAGLAVEVMLPQCLDPIYLQACQARARAVHVIPYAWRRGGQVPHDASVAAIAALIRQIGAAEVHQNTVVLDAPLIAARSAGVPSVVYLRELPDEDAELCARLQMSPKDLRALLLSQADRFVANSDATAQWIAAGAADGDTRASGRIAVLHNAVAPELFALPFTPQAPLRIALIGSNTAKKGVADARQVAQIAAALGLAAEFVLIGPMTADLRALGPLPGNMRHVGYAPDPVSALAQADVVLCLSHFAESFGRTVLEAMAAGRPVITYDRGTPPALVGAGGKVVPADDPRAVAMAVQAFLQQPETLQAMSQAARHRALEIRTQSENLPDSVLFCATIGHNA